MFCLFIILFPFLFRPLLLLTVKSHLRPFNEVLRKIWLCVTRKLQNGCGPVAATASAAKHEFFQSADETRLPLHLLLQRNCPGNDA